MGNIMNMSNSNIQYQQTEAGVPQVVGPQTQGAAPLPQAGYPAPVKQPKGWGKLLAAFGLFFAAQLAQIVFVLFGFLSRTDDGMLTVAELGGGVVALLFVVLLGGKKLATPSLEGMDVAWKAIKWIFITDLVIIVIEIVGLFIDGSFELARLWPLRVATLFLLCAGVGLFEESMFRGLCFQGLLARMGTSTKGIFWAVVLSSFIFGLMHVDFMGTNWSDPSQAVQAVLKVFQTGIFGFAAAVAVLKTGNLWPVIILHGLNDFMLMLVTNGLMNNPISTEYVIEGSEGLMVIALYLTLIFAYSPSVVTSMRMLKEHPAPDRGQFYKVRTVPVGYAVAPPVAAAVPQQVYAAPQRVYTQAPQHVYAAPQPSTSPAHINQGQQPPVSQTGSTQAPEQ